MKAGYVLSPGILTVEETDLPNIGPHEVLVRVRACGVCASDVKFFRGLKTYRETPYGRESPGFTGHEWAGEVVAAGEEVADFSVGDHVAPFLIISCGLCKFCRVGRNNLCPEKKYVHGGFAEYIKVPSHNLLRLPHEVDFEDACFVEPLACCLNGLEKLGLHVDDVVLVIGDGPMGLLNLMVLKTFGVKVILAGHHRHRLSMAEKLGAEYAANPLETDLETIVRKATDGYGADAVIIAVNNKQAAETALSLVSKGGIVNVFAGAHPTYEINIDINKIHYSELAITGSADAQKKHYKQAMEIIANKSITPSKLITHRYPLTEIQTAFETAESKQSVKTVVKPWG
ncbi:MAG: alcohol dehydrogenase catalytic domain-containing protein [Candidatus Caldarchaeum sp.]|nr:alcohol dehydrogenase catalytic domain-containing protein [Candidatus Caldarchaeum sp.]